MSILITGSAGFIGFHLSKYLLEKGENVIGLDNLNNYYSKSPKRDPKGPNLGNFRVLRGGGWAAAVPQVRGAVPDVEAPPDARGAPRDPEQAAT